MAKVELEIDFEALGEELAKHDFVEVVRCKDCKFRHDNSIGYWKPCREVIVDDDWFCADGERGE